MYVLHSIPSPEFQTTAFKLPPDFMDQVQQIRGTSIIFEDFDCLLSATFDEGSKRRSWEGGEEPRSVCTRERRRLDSSKEAETRVEHRTMTERPGGAFSAQQ